MSINRFAKNRDKNQPDIVKALRAAGASVTILGQHGVPDLLVGYQGKTFLLEVKLALDAPMRKKRHGNKVAAPREKTPSQVKWWAGWRGESAVIVRTVEEALKAIGATA